MVAAAAAPRPPGQTTLGGWSRKDSSGLARGLGRGRLEWGRHSGQRLGPHPVPEACSSGGSRTQGGYLAKGVLKQGGVAHKANVVDLQLKLLAAHVRLGSQDGCQDDV